MRHVAPHAWQQLHSGRLGVVPKIHMAATQQQPVLAGVRPVPLEIHIQGFEISSLEARMAAMLRPTYSAILNHARDGQPAIVFVPSRWHALRAALELLTFAAADGQPKRFLRVSTMQHEWNASPCKVGADRGLRT